MRTGSSNLIDCISRQGQAHKSRDGCMGATGRRIIGTLAPTFIEQVADGLGNVGQNMHRFEVPLPARLLALGALGCLDAWPLNPLYDAVAAWQACNTSSLGDTWTPGELKLVQISLEQRMPDGSVCCKNTAGASSIASRPAAACTAQHSARHEVRTSRMYGHSH